MCTLLFFDIIHHLTTIGHGRLTSYDCSYSEQQTRLHEGKARAASNEAASLLICQHVIAVRSYTEPASYMTTVSNSTYEYPLRYTLDTPSWAQRKTRPQSNSISDNYSS